MSSSSSGRLGGARTALEAEGNENHGSERAKNAVLTTDPKEGIRPLVLLSGNRANGVMFPARIL